MAVWGILCCETSVVGWNAQTNVLLRQVNGIKIKVDCVLVGLLRKLILTEGRIPSWRTSLCGIWWKQQWVWRTQIRAFENSWESYLEFDVSVVLIPQCFLFVELFCSLCKLSCPHWEKQKADAVSFSGMLIKSREMQSSGLNRRGEIIVVHCIRKSCVFEVKINALKHPFLLT